MRHPDAAAEESIGQRIRRLRLERGLSQRELAEPGISYAYLSRIEAGQRAPSLKALRIVARKLGVTPEHLETGAPVSLAVSRELRLTDAELRLRLRVNGDLPALEAAFRQLVDEARAEGETWLELRARIGVGLALACRREEREAIFHLELALSSGSVSALARPDVYETLARCHASNGSSDRAFELLDAALAELERTAPEEVVTLARLAGARAAIVGPNGNCGGGPREALAEALERAQTVPDPFARARMYATAATGRDGADPAATLALRRRAYGVLDAGDDVRELARAHLLCADLLLADGSIDQAGPHLDRAERLLALGGDALDLGRLRTRQSRRAVEAGAPEEAQTLALAAAELLQDHPAEQGEALHALASAQASAGDLDQAEESFRRAIEQLAAGRRWREAAGASRDWASYLRAAGRTDEALEVMDRATVLSIRGMGAEARRNR